MPSQDVLTSGIAPSRVDGAKSARRAQPANQCVLKHFHRRLGPPLRLIYPHLRGIEPVDNLVTEIKMRRLERSDHEGSVYGVGGGRGRSGGIAQLVVLDRPGSAASGYEEYDGEN